MYVKHSNLKLPDDLSKKIWRYMNFTKFVNLIDSESLFFCRADKFHDKWEGVFPRKMIEKFGLAEETFLSDDGKEYSFCEWQTIRERRSHLINCWHLSEHESDAMWKLYSGNDQVIAIRSNLQRLIDSLKANDDRVWIGQVEYEDFNNWLPKNRHFDGDNILQTFFLKRLGFEHEREIRAIINKAYEKHKSEVGILAKVDLNELIENVLRKYNIKFDVKKSELGIKPYM